MQSLLSSTQREGELQQGGIAGGCCPGSRPSSWLEVEPLTCLLLLDSLQESFAEWSPQWAQEVCEHLR